MPYYPFVDEVTGEEYGSFQPLHMKSEDYMWTDPDTCWFEILCNYIDMEVREEEVKEILNKVSMAEFGEEVHLDEDQKEIYEDIKEAPKALAGWYWWACFPGCLPDSEPFGPFSTEKEAVEDAGGRLEED